MDDDSKFGSMVKWGLGAVGLGAVTAVFALPRPFGIWVALAILILFVLFVGGYFLWRKMRARRQSRAFSSAIEAQTAAAPKAISDPNQKAALDKLRQKFQTGMQEFKSRGKDIYKLPWFVIIGESGSGKTEAIRHSGVEFPPGLQDELQGSGGTVNMDWWFTNRGIILDTAGSMIFRETRAGEAPEWGEFLRLLKKSRPNCPINGLFLVLSIESLIKDSADKIAEKASQLAQQLDLIQRTLDVRFPVYLLVTKADLLTGFREFFDSIDDPLLQHQMFGWSNPEPLDSHFRPDLVEQHLKSVADRLRRRRLALLLRESSAGSSRMGETAFFTAASVGKGQRRLDEVDALFALPESVMRLVPRLRRYLETVFVAGEWSAKPVFLRGIYFTSSMREGKALDEAIALATGLSVEQLPEDRSWEKNRAYFLRDLFVEKVFRESGLVTRATNTIQLLRKRRLVIFGSAGLALLLLIVFAGFNYSSLKRSVLKEADEWDAGAKYWNQNAWTLPIVRPTTEGGVNFAYVGNNQDVDVGSRKMSLVEYQQQIRTVASKRLDVSWVFRPLGLTSGLEGKREAAQLKIFEHGVLKPLIANTRAKMSREPDTSAVVRHQSALLALIQLQADVEDSAKRSSGLATNVATEYLSAYLSYLTDTDGVKVDPALVDVFSWTYSRDGSGHKEWPAEFLVDLKNPAVQRGINDGLEGLRKANLKTEAVISNRLAALNALTASYVKYREAEQKLFNSAGNPCGAPIDELDKVRRSIANNLADLASLGSTLKTPLTSLALCYDDLAAQAASASALGIERNLGSFPESFRSGSLFKQIEEQLLKFKQAASGSVLTAKNRQKDELAGLDLNYMALVAGANQSSYEVRWSLYLSSCSLLTNRTVTSDEIIGSMAKRFGSLTTNAQYVTSGLQTYAGPFAQQVLNVCTRTIGQNSEQLKKQFVESYAKYVQGRLNELKFPLRLSATEAFTGAEFIAKGKPFATGLEADLADPVWKSFSASAPLLEPLRNNYYGAIAKGLVNPDDTIAEMEFVFTPPSASSEEAIFYRERGLRYLKVTVDDREKYNQDLTRLAKGAVSIVTNVPVSAKVRFEFYSDVNRRNQSASSGEENWLLPRLIQKDQAQRLSGQETEWKLALPVSVNNKSGTLEAFTIRLKNPLPKREEWPK